MPTIKIAQGTSRMLELNSLLERAILEEFAENQVKQTNLWSQPAIPGCLILSNLASIITRGNNAHIPKAGVSLSV
jgi:hypothetical protein